MTDKDYKPIECGLHSEYELAIMHKSKIQLTWIDENEQQHSESTEPVDLVTKNKQEFLKLYTSNNILLEIRLDKILSFEIINKS